MPSEEAERRTGDCGHGSRCWRGLNCLLWGESLEPPPVLSAVRPRVLWGWPPSGKVGTPRSFVDARPGTHYLTFPNPDLLWWETHQNNNIYLTAFPGGNVCEWAQPQTRDSMTLFHQPPGSLSVCLPSRQLCAQSDRSLRAGAGRKEGDAAFSSPVSSQGSGTSKWGGGGGGCQTSGGLEVPGGTSSPQRGVSRLDGDGVAAHG